MRRRVFLALDTARDGDRLSRYVDFLLIALITATVTTSNQ